MQISSFQQHFTDMMSTFKMDERDSLHKLGVQEEYDKLMQLLQDISDCQDAAVKLREENVKDMAKKQEEHEMGKKHHELALKQLADKDAVLGSSTGDGDSDTSGDENEECSHSKSKRHHSMKGGEDLSGIADALKTLTGVLQQQDPQDMELQKAELEMYAKEAELCKAEAEVMKQMASALATTAQQIVMLLQHMMVKQVE